MTALAVLAVLCLAAPSATGASPSPEGSPGTGSLTLVEHVVNGPGGTARPDEWTVAARGPVEIEGAGGAPEVTGARVPAGAYRLTEYGGHPGYASTLWHCAGRAGPLPTGDGRVTVAAGDEVRCAVTNRPVAAGAGAETGTGAGLPGPGGSRAPAPAPGPVRGAGHAVGQLAGAGGVVPPGAGLFLAVVSGALCAVGFGFLLVRRRLRGREPG
ncbi:hypothetical protein ACQYWQ_15800 [Streptomyces sp. P6-2-1]|uniref:hypothetical protein n=1 Tax=Streptomyces sp. P6-2-1 TaxID=3422591 RepID=UPI003D36A3E2